MSYDDWPEPQMIGDRQTLWIEGYLQQRINDTIRGLEMVQSYRTLMSPFTAEQRKQIERQRELDRLRSEAYVNIQQLAEPKGYLDS